MSASLFGKKKEMGKKDQGYTHNTEKKERRKLAKALPSFIHAEEKGEYKCNTQCGVFLNLETSVFKGKYFVYYVEGKFKKKLHLYSL